MHIKNKRYLLAIIPQERHFMQKLNFKNNVSETLLINVYMRHLDFKDADPILNDPFSSAVVEQIDYDFAKFNDARLSKTGTVIRAKFFDDETLRLAAELDRPIIVQLGAGLDTAHLDCKKPYQTPYFTTSICPTSSPCATHCCPKQRTTLACPTRC